MKSVFFSKYRVKGNTLKISVLVIFEDKIISDFYILFCAFFFIIKGNLHFILTCSVFPLVCFIKCKFFCCVWKTHHHLLHSLFSHRTVVKSRGSQSVVSGSVASASLRRQKCKSSDLIPDLLKSETLGIGFSKECFHKSSRWFWLHAQVCKLLYLSVLSSQLY